MESTQTQAPKCNQESDVSNSARSVDDCSSNGLSLQRKAIAMQGSSNVIQRRAWIITRQLTLGLPFGLDNLFPYSMNKERRRYGRYWSKWLDGKRENLITGSAFTSEDTKRWMTAYHDEEFQTEENYGSERFHDLFDENGNLKEGKYGGRKYDLTKAQLEVDTDYLRPHHRHLLFDNGQLLRFGKGELKRSDNIGYGAGHPDKHYGLYSETDLSNYAVRNQVSQNPIEDVCLANAINSKECQHFGEQTFNLRSHNCQHWVNLVLDKYVKMKERFSKHSKKKKKEEKKEDAIVPFVGPGSERRVGVGIDMIDPM